MGKGWDTGLEVGTPMFLLGFPCPNLDVRLGHGSGGLGHESPVQGDAREGRCNYLLVETTGIFAEPLLAAGRRTALTFPLLPPPQKNWSPPSDSSPDTPTPAGISSLSRTFPV